MTPAIVLVEAEADLHEGPPFGPLGFADEIEPGLGGGAVGLVGVALDARADDVFPSGGAAAVARNDVVEVQILAVEHFAAVLAGVFVALEDIVARELDLFLGQPVVGQQQDDARDADAEGICVNGLLLLRVFGNVPPLVKAERSERAVGVIEDDLSLTLKKEGEGAPGGADIDRLP